MLEFEAREFVDIAYQFGSVMAAVQRSTQNAPETLDASAAIKRLLEETNRLGLFVTRDFLGEFFLEIMKKHPGTVSLVGEGPERMIHFKNTGLEPSRVAYHIECIHTALKAELRTTLFKVISKERATYSNSEWLAKSATQSTFPSSFKELALGGQCYSYGQPTAAAFHSMRALEPPLRALARRFELPDTSESWQVVIEQIEKAVRSIGQLVRSEHRNEDEKFFGAATSHLYFVKNAWRNHVAHGRDSYSDDEALRILTHTFDFIESLCTRFRE